MDAEKRLMRVHELAWVAKLRVVLERALLQPEHESPCDQCGTVENCVDPLTPEFQRQLRRVLEFVIATNGLDERVN